MENKNDILNEIKDFFNNIDCTWSISEIIQDELPKGIKEVEGKFLDELSVCELDENDQEKYLIDLEYYTTRVFRNMIKLVCNVLDSYKES